MFLLFSFFNTAKDDNCRCCFSCWCFGKEAEEKKDVVVRVGRKASTWCMPIIIIIIIMTKGNPRTWWLIRLQIIVIGLAWTMIETWLGYNFCFFGLFPVFADWILWSERGVCLYFYFTKTTGLSPQIELVAFLLLSWCPPVVVRKRKSNFLFFWIFLSTDHNTGCREIVLLVVGRHCVFVLWERKQFCGCLDVQTFNWHVEFKVNSSGDSSRDMWCQDDVGDASLTYWYRQMEIVISSSESFHERFMMASQDTRRLVFKWGRKRILVYS